MTDRFKGLDLIGRVPEVLWTKVCDIVQEAVIKVILKKKNCKKAKWLSDEALQIAEKRREAKGKREKELNAEFQRIAQSDQKAFLILYFSLFCCCCFLLLFLFSFSFFALII